MIASATVTHYCRRWPQDTTSQGLEAVVSATLDAPDDIRAQVHAAEILLDFFTIDPRRAKLLLESHTAEVLQKARLSSTHLVAGAMSAMARDLLGDSAPGELDTDLAAFTLVSGTMELVAAWLRGEIHTSREHLADLVAAMLLATTHISTMLPPNTN